MSEQPDSNVARKTRIHHSEEPMVSHQSQEFDRIFRSIYEMHSSESKALFRYIQRLLYQFRLSNAYEVKDILVEVYARGVCAIANGTLIKNPQAWIRRVALHVIHEFRRAADKIQYNVLDDEPYLASIDSDHLTQLVFQNDLKVILFAFEQLSSEDQQILDYRVVKALSWEQIQSRLEQEGEDKIALNTLRQRGHRALNRLRTIYTGMRETIKIEDFD